MSVETVSREIFLNLYSQMDDLVMILSRGGNILGVTLSFHYEMKTVFHMQRELGFY